MRKTPNINAILALPANNACSIRGADMGRRNIIPDDAKPEKLHLQRVTFSDGCYDNGGAYWGLPANLWCAFSPDNTDNPEPVRVFVRADNREEAKETALEELSRNGDGWSFFR